MSRQSLVDRLMSWTLYPGTLASFLWLAFFVMDRGYPSEIVVLGLSVMSVLLVMALERIHPHFEEWNQARGDVRTDLFHLAITQFVSLEAFDVIFRGVLFTGAAWVALFLEGGPWPTQAPLALQVGLALLIGEFFHYWWHRFSHGDNVLWRFHATHHSSERLYWLASVRFHPVDNVVAYGLQVTPLILLGCGPEALALFTLFVSIHGLFQHGNVKVRCGWLNYVFSTPELHRWHHSRKIEDANANYGGYLIVWDLVFGTWHLPRDRAHQAHDVGLHDMPQFPRDFAGQLLSPLRWGKLAEENESNNPPTSRVRVGEDIEGID